MIAYKGFQKDLKCRGFQFQEYGINETEKANCRQNGFHCAENPLDCLCYYPNWKNSVYYIVDASGDLDEDGEDSKISCTKMRLLKMCIRDRPAEAEWIKLSPTFGTADPIFPPIWKMAAAVFLIISAYPQDIFILIFCSI